MADSKRQAYAFIPRCINHKPSTAKQKAPKAISSSSQHSSSCFDAENGSYSTESDNDNVKQFSSQQRWPSTDEPECIICKRFGEYICDETDEDVCSLECKALHLKSIKLHSEQAHLVHDNASVLREEDCSSNPHQEGELFDKHYSSVTIYKPVKDIISLSEEQMSIFRQKLEIRTKGSEVPKLIQQFNQCLFTAKLLQNLKENGYISPTPVQMQTIPTIMSGHDVLVSACTSSGKTASFVLPIIHNIYNCLSGLPPVHEFCKYPIALIITPTRELAIQIEEIAKVFSKSLNNLRTALLIGGVPIAPQLHRLKHKIQIVVGTPGRINDILVNYESLQLKYVKMVVLDEVDVMLQMGFQNQIQNLVEQIPSKPQFMMFSATIPPSTENLASKMMGNPVFISIGLSGLPNKSIKQIVLWVEDKSKKKKLFSIIEDSKHFLPPALVFVDSKMGADMLTEAITKRFVLHCESIHSDKSQAERTRILQDFLTGAFDILVSTNVVGRGIDLVNVRQVILFDMPSNIEDYTHQVGRAGGLHSSGFVIAFINNSNKKIFFDLKSLFETTNNKLPDQLLHSQYLKNECEKKDNKKKKLKHTNSQSSWRNDEIVNPQNLLQILTKNRKPLL